MSRGQVDAPCCLGTVHQGELKGKQLELGPLTTYVTGDESPGGRAVLIIPDVYGFNIPNTRLYADQLAAEGMLVLLPDIFHGDALSEGFDKSQFAEWMQKHPQDTQVNQLDRLLTDMHQQFKPRSVSCIGFCWGGLHACKLASSGRVSAAVVAHGSFITKEAIEAVKQPLLFLFPDRDQMIPEDFRKEIEGIMAKKQQPTKGKFYPGCAHGWTIRGDPSDPKQRENAADAFAETVSWLKTHAA
ncbi:hypothetical protein ABBQ38_013136 [Trebouxia sp. C0009 RCD-2024]